MMLGEHPILAPLIVAAVLLLEALGLAAEGSQVLGFAAWLGALVLVGVAAHSRSERGPL